MCIVVLALPNGYTNGAILSIPEFKEQDFAILAATRLLAGPTWVPLFHALRNNPSLTANHYNLASWFSFTVVTTDVKHLTRIGATRTKNYSQTVKKNSHTEKYYGRVNPKQPVSWAKDWVAPLEVKQSSTNTPKLHKHGSQRSSLGNYSI